MSRGILTNRSGAITTGGTAQDVMDANSSRNYLVFLNLSDTDMFIDFGQTATVDSAKVVAGASYESPAGFTPTDRISVLCATTGKKFFAKEG